MEERCALCGSRTAQMDLDGIVFADLEVRVCPYCRKQLEQAVKNPVQNRDWLQSILQMDTKGARTEAVTAALTRLCYQNDIPRPQVPPPVTPAAVPPAVPPVSAQSAAQSEAAKTAQLEARVTALETKIRKMQRRALLSKILGTVIPILVVCILAIFLVRSQYFQNILDYYDRLGELANRM